MEMMDDGLAKELISMHERMVGMRVNWDTHWQECADYFMPRKDDVFGPQVKGAKKNQLLYDSTSTITNELLASALHGMLTNPSSTWFSLTTGDSELDKIGRVKTWLQKASTKMVDVMNQSNFQTEIHEVYLDLGAFGTGSLRIEEDDEKIVRFSARPIYESWVMENHKGTVDKISMKKPMNSRDIVSKFNMKKLRKELGDTGDYKVDQIEKDPLREWDVIHMVMPKEDLKSMDHTGKKRRKPFASFHILKELGIILEEKFFEEFPYAIPRWSKTSDEVYGRGPGMSALPDTKMLNQMMKATIRGAQKIVDPPLQVPDEGMVLPLRTIPGGINYYRAGTQDRIVPLITNARIDISEQLMESVRSRIRQNFFIDQLQLNEGPQMTATEVMQRTEEKLRMMGPVLGRQHTELLKPVVDRVFGIMFRRGELPGNIPPELEGRQLPVEFSSMIARAQKASEADNIQRVIGFAAPLAQMDPTIMDNVDPDGYLRHLANIFNVSQEVFRTEEEVQAMRKQRAEAQQKQEQMAEQQSQAEVISKVGGATQQ